MIIAAIDPGLSGALAILARRDTLGVHDLPVAGEGAQRQIAPASLAQYLLTAGVTAAVIERASARPGQGVSGVFRYGTAYGVCLGVLGTLGIPVEFVAAGVWKRAMQLDKNKENSRIRAINRFPRYTDLFARKMDHNRAEAALLADWYWKKCQQ